MNAVDTEIAAVLTNPEQTQARLERALCELQRAEREVMDLRVTVRLLREALRIHAEAAARVVYLRNYRR